MEIIVTTTVIYLKFIKFTTFIYIYNNKKLCYCRQICEKLNNSCYNKFHYLQNDLIVQSVADF